MSNTPVFQSTQDDSTQSEPSPRLAGVGLSFSGGGAAGGGAMTGFACALDLFLGSHGVNDLESFTGVSAGAIVASYLAAGISPLEMVRATFRGRTAGFVPFRRRHIYRPNLDETGATLERVRKAALQIARSLVRRRDPDLELGAAGRTLGLLPSALLSNAGLEVVIRENLERHGGNDFSALASHLRIIFYDLIANERIVAGNGPGEVDSIAVSEAVTASATIPGVYTPRRLQLDGRTLLGIDGGSAGVTLDVRDKTDLELLVAYNHMGYDETIRIDHASALSVVNLSRQLLLNQRNVDEIANYMDDDPSRHVWLFTSPPTSMATMMSYNEMLSQCRTTYALAQAWLSEHLDYYGTFLEGLGARVDPELARVSFDEILEHGDALKQR